MGCAGRVKDGLVWVISLVSGLVYPSLLPFCSLLLRLSRLLFLRLLLVFHVLFLPLVFPSPFSLFSFPLLSLSSSSSFFFFSPSCFSVSFLSLLSSSSTSSFFSFTSLLLLLSLLSFSLRLCYHFLLSFRFHLT